MTHGALPTGRPSSTRTEGGFEVTSRTPSASVPAHFVAARRGASADCFSRCVVAREAAACGTAACGTSGACGTATCEASGACGTAACGASGACGTATCGASGACGTAICGASG